MISLKRKNSKEKKYFMPHIIHVTISDTTGINTHSTCEVFIGRFIKKRSGKYKETTRNVFNWNLDAFIQALGNIKALQGSMKDCGSQALKPHLLFGSFLGHERSKCPCNSCSFQGKSCGWETSREGMANAILRNFLVELCQRYNCTMIWLNFNWVQWRICL